MDNLQILIQKLIDIQDYFYKNFGINDIYSSSKVYEILISDKLNHELLPSHAGSRDGKDINGTYEYKHFKESSSNHSWTFNDFSDNTIEKLKQCYSVIFAHIDDKELIPVFDWYYDVSGAKISEYLSGTTTSIKNARSMINISPRQLETVIGVKKIYTKDRQDSKGFYTDKITQIFETARAIENVVNTKNILSSNKLWEILVSLHTGHRILSEQKKHDAIDSEGNYYEYKVSKGYSWGFEDISEKVLNKFLEEKSIVLAIVDKRMMKITQMWYADPVKVVNRLKQKLQDKQDKFLLLNKKIRRVQASLSKTDLIKIEAVNIPVI